MSDVDDLIIYKQLPVWDIHSLPEGFAQPHNTKVGTWAKLTIHQGSLRFYSLNSDGSIIHTQDFDATEQPKMILPQQWHKIEPLTEDLQCQVAFYCQPSDYYAKKYQLNPPHSEMAELLALWQQNADRADSVVTAKQAARPVALDLGCGVGRNSLYLQQQGFEVLALDCNVAKLANLDEIITNEKLEHIYSEVVDANVTQDWLTILYQHQQFDSANRAANNSAITAAHAEAVGASNGFDIIVATVSLMFMQASAVPHIIRSMQAQTKSGGFHLIVCAMSTEQYPAPADFSFTLAAGELKSHYSDKEWKLHKYNENMGELHRTDANGKRIQLQFATLIAQKR